MDNRGAQQSVTTDATTSPASPEDGLRAGTIGLGGALMQSVAQISPTLGIFYTIAFTTTQAGGSAPLTYLAAFLVCLLLAAPMVGLARHLPSAGGLYTYVSAGIGPRAGFLTGWLYGVSVCIVPAALAAFTGAVLEDELSSAYGIGVPWWVYSVVILAICFACAFRGIAISVKFLVVMTVFEMAVGLGLALTGLVSPGPGGVNLSGFNPANISNSSGFFLAVVLSIFAFTGFEGAAAVGEESRDPRRIIPRAITGSLVFIGIFYVVTAWGLQIGWGTDDLPALAASPTAPAFVLADRLWNGASLVVLVALVNSGLGVCIACTTSSTRTLYGIARTGALPHALTRVHSTLRTPVTAVVLQSVAAVTVCLVLGLALGPYNLFNLLGATGTFVYIPIFILMNVAAFRFFRSRFPSEFSIGAHVVAPVISTAALLLIGYNSIVPLPDFPVLLAPFIAASYLLSGVAVLIGRNLRPGRRGWMEHAGELPDVD
ncbi:APC family permease [Kineococcus rhizosphaerae]|uniref:Amino acid/polyamine/organocation transporter (APC superfamily) n=1 Tax=Kineococcus rhizosphaerae TaxID=559628 RepID=A0A2T0QXI3_9ACTN|nr:APC family permease [Kineococcus rhizosphaerae]PRY10570.1 amino acid/polyamine/organocation transporter (APC superfamily) [Kineococcus rhizosphaerae]